MTSGSSSVPDSASSRQVESSGEFSLRPTSPPRDTDRVCCRQCLSPRVPGQGPRATTGFWKLDMLVCQRIREDGGARRPGSLLLSNCSILWAQHPAAAALPASPRPQRHLVGGAGCAFPLWLRLPHRGSGHLPNNQGAALSLPAPDPEPSLLPQEQRQQLSCGSQLLTPPMPYLHTSF